MSLPFIIGSEVSYAGARWWVERVLGTEAVLLRSDTGEEVLADPLRITFLGAPALRGTVTRVADETRYDDAGWAAATRRRDLIVGLANRPRTAADVTAVGEALGVTPRRVWALLRQVRVHGDSITHFLPTRHVRRAKRLDRRVEAIIQQSIDQHYAKLARPSLNSLIGEVERRCRAAGVVPPCGKSIKARVRAQDQLWLTRRREGWGKARALRLLTGGDRGACAPWERVQIDSTPCDIRLVRELDRTVIGRPNITFAIDLYSRTVLGFSVSLQGASTVTVATCLAHACLPKQDWLMRRDLANVHWPVWGKPTILEYDQGPEHEAKGIQRGLRLHGIRSKIRAKGHPEHHGTIERLIGTMMRRVHERRGTTFSNVNERGDIEPAELACLTLPELERIIVLEIDSYHHAVHAGIGDRPLDRYLAYYQRPDLSDRQRIPPIPPAERFLLDFLPFERRRLVRTGLRLFRVDYSSHDLLPMWRRQNHAPVERIVVYDPRSLATIWVVDDVTGEYVAVPCRVPRADMTLAESEAARQRLQALKAADRTEARLFENVLEVRAIEEHGRTATARMKAERSRQARRAALRPIQSDGRSSAPHAETQRPGFAPPADIAPFTDVEDL
jgi:putative transposase